jgi:hypothetical protein
LENAQHNLCINIELKNRTNKLSKLCKKNPGKYEKIMKRRKGKFFAKPGL